MQFNYGTYFTLSQTLIPTSVKWELKSELIEITLIIKR
jgi:hypothetical protein